jgi:hypothetical protein
MLSKYPAHSPARVRYIAAFARDYVDVGMFNGLSGGQPIVHADIEPIRLQPQKKAISHYCYQVPDRRLFEGVQFVDAPDVLSGNDECMPIGYRVSVGESNGMFILNPDSAEFNGAERTVTHWVFLDCKQDANYDIMPPVVGC